MGAMFIGQQFVQNVLGYSTLQAGLAILPGAVGMILVAPRSARLVESHGSRFTLLLGFSLLPGGLRGDAGALGRDRLLLGGRLGYLLVGVGVGFAGTPASRSLTGSDAGAQGGHGLRHRRPPARPRRRDHAVDPRRPADRGLRGQLRRPDRRLPEAAKVSERVQNELTKSFSSAANTAEQYPQYAPQIVHAARTSFLDGGDWTYAAGMIADRARDRRRLLPLPPPRGGAGAAGALPRAKTPRAPVESVARCATNSTDADNRTMAHRLLRAGDAFWRRSNQMKVWNTDLGKQLEATQLGARLWRLEPGQASTLHRHLGQEELYVLLEGHGRVRVDGELLDLEPMDTLLVERRVRPPALQRHRCRAALAGGRRPAGGGQHAGDEPRAAGGALSRWAESAAAGARRGRAGVALLSVSHALRRL